MKRNYEKVLNKRPSWGFGCSISLQKHGHDPTAVLSQGIFSAYQTPIVEERPLAKCVGLDHFVDRNLGAEFPALLTLQHDGAEELVVGAIPVQQMLLALGDELRG